MKLNLEDLIKKVDLVTKEYTTHTLFIKRLSKRLITNNFEENISIEQLKLKISNLKPTNEIENYIRETALTILDNLNKKNIIIGKTEKVENQKFNLVYIKKEHYILNTISTESEKTECDVAFCRNISSYVRVDFTIKPLLKNNLELYVALVLCNDHYNNLK
ncbi:hypothetical protein [Spiroplasma endosymbiont of Atherix ibis]|uniref:hypothetical protein n=1 Tax=Spiroplasma endosymbiont of Atherix ibis TaxID=3066291 RepID=UPI0030CD3278